MQKQRMYNIHSGKEAYIEDYDEKANIFTVEYQGDRFQIPADKLFDEFSIF